MNAAIDEHEELKDDADGKQHLKNYFVYTAHYIVAAMEYMRPDQVGTIDFVAAIISLGIGMFY